MNQDPVSEDLAQYSFSSYAGFNAQLIRWRYEHLSKFFKGATCLELGSSDGQGTEFLLKHFDEVTAVDGSRAAIDDLDRRLRNPRLQAVCSLFEDLDLNQRFDTVVLAHILEHVERPREVLGIAARYLNTDGVLIVDVPNALSLHRQMGVLMGLLETETALNEADRSIGHRRVYTPESFKEEVVSAGFQIQEFGGLFLKLLANHQIESAFDADQQTALLELGKRYPALASEIYVVAGMAQPHEGRL